jgi:hypothetical protein
MEMGEVRQVLRLWPHRQQKEIEVLSQLQIRLLVCEKSCQRPERAPEIAIDLGCLTSVGDGRDQTMARASFGEAGGRK